MLAKNIDGVLRRTSAHVAAWRIMTGTWPPIGKVIDHINDNGADNRWSNLRLLSNGANVHRSREGARRGVTRLVSESRGKPCTIVNLNFTSPDKDLVALVAEELRVVMQPYAARKMNRLTPNLRRTLASTGEQIWQIGRMVGTSRIDDPDEAARIDACQAAMQEYYDNSPYFGAWRNEEGVMA